MSGLRGSRGLFLRLGPCGRGLRSLFRLLEFFRLVRRRRFHGEALMGKHGAFGRGEHEVADLFSVRIETSHVPERRGAGAALLQFEIHLEEHEVIGLGILLSEFCHPVGIDLDRSPKTSSAERLSANCESEREATTSPPATTYS